MSIRSAFASFLLAVALLIGLSAAPTRAQQPEAGGSPIAMNVPDSVATKVFVLGSPHLSNVEDQFEPSMLDSLMTALEAFAPQAIAVERLSGRAIASMERWGGPYKTYVQKNYFGGSFVHHGRLVRKQAGWTWGEANQRADSLLTIARSDSGAFGVEDRLALIRSLTAAYRLPSAFLQWKYLSPEDRAAQRVLPDTTAEDLNERLDAANETYTIGAELAHERGLQRLYPMDDQAQRIPKDEIASLYNPVMDSVGKALMSSPMVKRTLALQKAGLKSGSLFPMYRYMNTETWSHDRVDLHWKELLRRSTPEDVGQTGVALYEVRNLNMVAEIQRMVSQHPGERVLVVVGGSHKPFFDAYLRQMMGVKVVEATEVLPGM